MVEHASAASYDDEFDSEESEVGSLLGIAGLGAHRESSKKMALVLDGDEAHNPLGMADELVAQAAFEPNSVDISRFLPDVSEFRNEPDEPTEADGQIEAEPELVPVAEQAILPDVAADELDHRIDALEFPMDASPDLSPDLSSDPSHVDDAFEQLQIAEPADPPEAAPQEANEGRPTAQSAWHPPEWATEMLEPQATVPDATPDA